MLASCSCWDLATTAGRRVLWRGAGACRWGANAGGEGRGRGRGQRLLLARTLGVLVWLLLLPLLPTLVWVRLDASIGRHLQMG